jgi:hypothetical protein
MFTIRDWQRQYAEALLESNREELAKRMSSSNLAIAASTLQLQEAALDTLNEDDLEIDDGAEDEILADVELAEETLRAGNGKATLRDIV